MNEYVPNYTVRPNETAKELLEDKGWSVEQFAKETGKSIEYVNQIFDGELLYNDPEVAELLEVVFLVSKSFWVNLENNHQEALKRGASIIE